MRKYAARLRQDDEGFLPSRYCAAVDVNFDVSITGPKPRRVRHDGSFALCAIMIAIAPLVFTGMIGIAGYRIGTGQANIAPSMAHAATTR